MALAYAQVLLKSQLANHLSALQRHQLQAPLVIHHQALAPHLNRLKRHLQHLTAHSRFVVERGDALQVGLGKTLDHDRRFRHVHCISSYERQLAGQCRG